MQRPIMLILAFASSLFITNANATNALNDTSKIKANQTRSISSLNKIAPNKPAVIKPTSSATSSVWIYELQSSIYQDIDNDGYYQNLALRLDLDTQQNQSHEVVATFYLQGSNGQIHHLFSSDFFTINSNSTQDSQQFEFQLLSDFTSDYYQIIIEIQDRDQQRLLHADNHDFSALQDIALEGQRFDQDNQLSIYSLRLELDQDADNDGYFEGFTLHLDADSHFQKQTVVADLIIEKQVVYTSRPFTLYGNSSSDQQHFDVLLANGFRPSHYDLSIEIRDASDGYQLHYLQASAWTSLGHVALESRDYIQQNNYLEIEVIQSAGALQWLLIGLLPLIWLKRKKS
ncbi:choice-of-anchor H family protein [Pseudoalteromonas tunicata]|uniref:choice-of-anchor H family protein n=1 Tax=Pseudoalteromonas tunicata TaxID=314281 RepID=UPI0027401A5F|nr:choice-of-anchor H family protein [Pseudoalteromonas tunicata]MDP5213629.1 choice-of-anchor H family protein [Pseudoalteromonas tunicata]